jgi:hypothetical protein
MVGITAAGPRWNFTIFPIKTRAGCLMIERVSELAHGVKKRALK